MRYTRKLALQLIPANIPEINTNRALGVFVVFLVKHSKNGRSILSTVLSKDTRNNLQSLSELLYQLWTHQHTFLTAY